MGHIVVPEAEALLDQEIRVLDKGFVRLVDYMGGDERIVAAARVSYGQGTRTYREDARLIDYLLRNAHTSPFEQVILTFHCKMPIFVARQWVRHRTARLNEISARYSVLEDEFYEPEPERVQYQSRRNKQGRDEEMEAPPEVRARVLDILREDRERAYNHYQEMLDLGIARELARTTLPVSIYTQWYWQIDLHNLFHFIRLRLDGHAQYEIRAYAEVLGRCAKAVAPAAWAAFERHGLQRVSLSGERARALSARLAAVAPELVAEFGLPVPGDEPEGGAAP